MLLGPAVLLVIAFTIPQIRARLLVGKGDIEAACGNKTAALEDYKGALSSLPDDEEALLKAGVLFRDLGRDQDSYDCFKKLYAHPSGRLVAVPYLVPAALRLRATEEGLNYAQEWVKQAPTNAYAYDARGLVYAQMKKRDQALEDFNKSVQLDHASPALADRDDLLQKSREWKNITEGIFDPQLEENTKDYTALVRNARRLFRGYSWAGAEASATEAIKLHPDRPQAYMVRAKIFMESGKYPQEVKDLDMVQKLAAGKEFVLPQIENEPVDKIKFRCHVQPLSVWYYRGGAYAAMNQWKEALLCFDKAISLGHEEADFHLMRSYQMRAKAERREGNLAQAGKDMAHAAAINARIPNTVYDDSAVQAFY